MKLSPKQKLFCENYVLNGYNATQAYLAAGYAKSDPKIARVNAAKLLSKDNIQYHIRTLESEKEGQFKVSKDDILNQLGKIAFGNLDDLVEFKHGKAVLKDDIDPQKRRNALAGINSISSSMSFTKDGQAKSFSIGNKDRLKALELIARMTGVLDGGSDKGDGKPAVSKVLEALRNIGK
ncbi:MAG: terminase small subunit [Kangiellaceae bacterium]|jgi:hypothetical protein|nr:terminase small subunit [Kangiellaceae bacterium]